MTKVFISGSMKIKNLDPQVLYRLKHIIDSNYEVLVGDANGVDSSIQNFFIENQYSNVTVYCTGEIPRNNLGRWKTCNITSNASPNSRAFYTAKDKAMANDCDFGLMVWDSKSTGTLSNAIELLKQEKKSRVFVNKSKEFVRIVTVDDLESLTTVMSDFAFKKANEKLKVTDTIEKIKYSSIDMF
ncbi:hypothetical protein EDB60_105258 [Vibrio crassostreae]|uniref:hypothetical protein n=1 Tax=Vibrio crassostreae TaxID=246167 RepID=UPI001042A09C|nr:hypothetical protein [Vibrio crassostreae]TCN70997.1 hypothetical protein EDB60_105258 [Vibrio crassostreae]